MLTLKILDLSNNKIRRLPRSLGAMTSRETILVGRNLLRTLPQEFALMKGLRHLTVRHNRLEFLPPAFGRLPLEEFLAADNQLDEIAEVQLTGGPSRFCRAFWRNVARCTAQLCTGYS